MSKKRENDKKPPFVRAGVVYTRDADTNTPIDKTASESQIQAMWEERFGIRQPPLTRVKNYGSMKNSVGDQT